ncbi:LuxR family transcriptional regulator [Streptomyces sp. NPDC052701]|uniref:LuxR family transcriptional regulator n=1 Tax=Streptomyces sp. NPDC052701 TaxID=3155533 RepID=UPI003420FDE3
MLLERERELALMADALQQADDGGLLAVVHGSFGIGKSAFVRAVADLGRAHGALVLEAQAAPTERQFAFGVARQLLDPVLALADEADHTRWLKEAGQRARLPDSGRFVRELPGSAVRVQQSVVWFDALVDGMARDRTVLIVVDDLHWSDSESLQALLRTARAGRRRTLLVCSLAAGDVRTARPCVRELLTLGNRTVELNGLSAAGTRQVLEAVFEEAPDAAFMAACEDLCGGNPFLLHAVAEDARFHGLRPTARDAAVAGVLRPLRVRRRLLQYLHSLPDHVRRTACALTLLGAHAEPGLVAGLAQVDPPRYADALRVLRPAGLVDDPERRVRVGSMLRDVLEEGLPLEERAAMRVMAAELLHRTGHPAEQAAEHLMSVVSPQGREAVAILRRAADSALRRGSPRDAARYLGRALLDTAPAGAGRASLLIDLANAERSFATAASQRHVAEAVPLLEAVRERAAALSRLGPLLMDPHVFRFDELLRQVSADLDAVPSPDVLDRELALRIEARERFLGSQHPAHQRAALRRLRDLGPNPPARSMGERELLSALVHVAMVTNTVPADELAPLASRLLAQEPAHPDHVHTALPLAVNVLVAAGRTDGAAGWLREAQRIAERCGDHVEQAVIRAEQALLALADGSPAAARTGVLHEDALSGPEMSGLPAMCAAVLAMVALETGEPGLAHAVLTRHRLSDRNPFLAGLLDMAGGVLAARRGELRVALDHFHVAGRRMERIGWRNPAALPWSSAAALMHHRLGETEQAVAAARSEAERARAWGGPVVLGRALVVLGRVTPGQDGATVLEEAVDVLEKSPNSYELGRALHALGTRAETDHTRREEILRRALDLATECDAPGLETEVLRLLRRQGFASPRKPVALTPSEDKVARLAAAGMSNQGISAELSISSRMVEKHLTSCYRKLGISGRPHLREALAERDSRSHRGH